MSPTRYGGVPCPKPEKRATVKRRKQRAEAAVIQSVRAACVERDGYCRVAKDAPVATGHLLGCGGPSEWAHFGGWKRARTRGQPASHRHTLSGSLMLCRAHHQAYDAGRVQIDATAAGAEGPLVFWFWTKGTRP